MSSDDRRSTPVAAIIALGAIAVLLIYFGPFVAILIDEAVLQTYFFSQHLPPWMEGVVRIVYWPVLKLLGIE
jgi:hypothetical protein